MHVCYICLLEFIFKEQQDLEFIFEMTGPFKISENKNLLKITIQLYGMHALNCTVQSRAVAPLTLFLTSLSKQLAHAALC